MSNFGGSIILDNGLSIPAANSIYARLDGTNQPFTGAITINSGATSPALTVNMTSGSGVKNIKLQQDGTEVMSFGNLLGFPGWILPAGGINFIGFVDASNYFLFNGVGNEISVNGNQFAFNSVTNQFNTGINFADGVNVVIADTNVTGSKFGGFKNSKLAFYNATPLAQQDGTGEISSILNNLGFITSSSVYSLTTSGAATFTGGVTLNTVGLTMTAVDIITDTTTGMRIGTGATQKLGFFGTTPVVKQTAVTDLGTVLSNLGLRVAGVAYPITTGGTLNFSGTWTISGSGGQFTTNNFTIRDVSVILGTTTGTSFGTGTTQKLSFYGVTPIVQPGATTDLGTVLSNLGLRVSGTAYPITTSGAVTLGSLTSGRVTFAGTAGLLQDDADLTFATDTLSYTKGVTTLNTYTAGSGGTTDGMSWNDSTQKAHAVYEAGVKQMLVGTLFTQTADGTSANSVTEDTISSTGVGTLTLPANFFVSGKTIKIRGLGYHSATAGPTIRIKIKFGSTIILDTTTVNSHNSTNEEFAIDGTITCRTTGATGTVHGQGLYKEYQNPAVDLAMVNTSPVVIDTTASQAITVTAQWGTASASNTITLTNLTVEVLN